MPQDAADIAATIYHCLGIDPRAKVTDREGRPFVIGMGKPLQAIIG